MNNTYFLKAAINALRSARGEPELDACELRASVRIDLGHASEHGLRARVDRLWRDGGLAEELFVDLVEVADGQVLAYDEAQNGKHDAVKRR